VRLIVWSVLALLIASCELVVPSTPTPGHTLTKPPAAFIDGVAGQPWAWCWADTCADGSPANPNAPLVREPEVLSFEVQPTRVDVAVLRSGADGRITEQPVPMVGGKIGPIPAGSWDNLTVSVNFAVGDAAFVWRLH
jgi:hypothetical protein